MIPQRAGAALIRSSRTDRMQTEPPRPEVPEPLSGGAGKTYGPESPLRNRLESRRPGPAPVALRGEPRSATSIQRRKFSIPRSCPPGTALRPRDEPGEISSPLASGALLLAQPSAGAGGPPGGRHLDSPSGPRGPRSPGPGVPAPQPGRGTPQGPVRPINLAHWAVGGHPTHREARFEARGPQGGGA